MTSSETTANGHNLMDNPTEIQLASEPEGEVI